MTEQLKKLNLPNSNIICGSILETSDHFVAFGNKNLGPDQLQNLLLHHDVRLNAMNQQHTTQISALPIDGQPCDGIFTNKSLEALVVRTADCLPLLAINEDRIFALHCGRKGLIDGIIQNLKKNADDYKPNWTFFIGPHITPENYEIGTELTEEIRQKYPKTEALVQISGKSCFSLKTFTLEQLAAEFTSATLLELDIDTFSDENYYSYRRDNKTPERNYSFIWKKV